MIGLTETELTGTVHVPRSYYIETKLRKNRKLVRFFRLKTGKFFSIKVNVYKKALGREPFIVSWKENIRAAFISPVENLPSSG